MQRNELVEAMARATWDRSEQLAWEEGSRNATPWDDAFNSDKAAYRYLAQAALAAIEAQGLAVVPVEPTATMKLAGCDVLLCNKERSWAIAAGNAYRAMLAASPLRGEG
jgi:hypothetical protein